MLRSAVAIAGIIGLTAISHRLLRHYLSSIKSQDKNQNKAGSTEPEAILSESHSYARRNMSELQGNMSNSNKAFDPSEWSISILGDVMEALADPNTHLIGIYGFHIKKTFLRRVFERVERDQLFGIVVRANVTKYPDVWKIQEDIARQLGFTFKNIYEDERAKELIHMIKKEHDILIVLCDLYKGLDLSSVGLPCGADHMGCKILLTSAVEDVLSKCMHTQINFTA